MLNIQNKRDEHLSKRRQVPDTIESTDSEENDKPIQQQSLETIVQNAASSDQSVQLSAVQAARYGQLVC